MKQKGSIELILVFAILLAMVGGGAYYFGTQKDKGVFTDDFGTPIFNPSEDKKQNSSKTPENDETANWKTYTNSTFSYSLKYAPNPALKQFSCSSQEAFKEGEDVFVLEDVTSTFPKCGFGGYAWPISINIEDSKLDCKSGDGYKATEMPINISGINSIRCDKKYTGYALDRGPSPDNIAYIFVPKDGKYFRFELGDLKYSETFNQILSTFKFTP